MSTLQWLANNESSDGAYGLYLDHWAASAAYALWLNDSSSPKAKLTYSWLAQQADNPTAWYWGSYGEADVPGFVLFTISASHNLDLIQVSTVTSNLSQFQNSTGGFRGYYDLMKGSVTSSIDTDMALLGLAYAGEISMQGYEKVTNYLLSLQNSNGSFNLTSGKGSDPIYSLGPDPISITAVTVLALKSAGFSRDNPNVSKAISFLNGAVSSNFNGRGHVFAAAASALAFKAYDEPDNAITATVYILDQQNSDGGFSDVSRSSNPQSNALDTGWAAIALETEFSEENVTAQVNSPPVAGLVFNPSAPSVGTLVRFDGASSFDPDGDHLSYLWTFGDGSSAVGVSASHAYGEAGNFTVTLTTVDSGSNPSALSNTKWLSLTVQPETVQNAKDLPLTTTELGFGIAVIAVIAVSAVYLAVRRRTTVGKSTFPTHLFE
jgi:PKD repeat protein